MSLPVLKSSYTTTPADWVRLFHQSQLEWCRAVGEETELDLGRWISNPDMPGSNEANCLLDARLLPGLSATDLIDQMHQHCRERGVPWRRCSLNPSAIPDQVEPLATTLRSAGWREASLDILRKGDGDLFPPSDLTIIPARSSYRHYRQLMQQRMDESADTAMLHLDDPHLDALLALRDGEAVGSIGVLASGETGTLRDWFVSESHRHHGVGRCLLGRAMEIAKRGLLRNLMIGLPPELESPRRICEQAGFKLIGRWRALRSPVL